MKQRSSDAFEEQLFQAARAFPYPDTPNIALAVTVRRRKAALRSTRIKRSALAAILLIVGLTLAVPPARATVFEALRIGAVRILFGEVTPMATATVPPSATQAASPTPLSSILDLALEMPLAEAQGQVSFPIRLPSYPEGLGPPERAFLADLGVPMVILVWSAPQDPESAQMSLHIIQESEGVLFNKQEPAVIRQTAVHGQRAYWTEGPYILELGGQGQFRQLIEGKVLIWMEGELTYRLESALSLEEAVKVAESLE